MRRTDYCLPIWLLAAAFFAAAFAVVAWTHGGEPTPAISVHFAPGADCRKAIVAEVGKAKTEVLVLAYQFTEPIITDALITAKHRGIEVRVICDRSQFAKPANGSKGFKVSASLKALGKLDRAGVICYSDAEHRIAHNKVLVIDGGTVITGSYNLSKNAAMNAENIVVIRRPEIAREYAAEWTRHSQHSTAWRESLDYSQVWPSRCR